MGTPVRVNICYRYLPDGYLAGIDNAASKYHECLPTRRKLLSINVGALPSSAREADE